MPKQFIKPYFYGMGRRSKNELFEGVKVVDTASKGKTVAKTNEGAIIFLTSGVPGDVVDIATYKKRKGFYEGNIVKFHSPFGTQNRTRMRTFWCVRRLQMAAHEL